MLFGNSEALINVMPELNISFSSNVREALSMLVVINQDPCSTNFVPVKDPIDSSILNLFFSVLLKNLVFLIKMLLLSMPCIAYAFGKHGYTNVHLHETPYPYSTPLVW
jgi:hypothetical protein